MKGQPSAHGCTEQQTLPTDTLKPQRSWNRGMAWVAKELKGHEVLVPFHGRATFHYTRVLQILSSLALDNPRMGQPQLL